MKKKNLASKGCVGEWAEDVYSAQKYFAPEKWHVCLSSPVSHSNGIPVSHIRYMLNLRWSLHIELAGLAKKAGLGVSF